MENGKRRVVVVGASSAGGLGEATARRFAADGHEVIVAGRRATPLKALAESIGGRFAVCDITDEDSVAELAAFAGPVDVAINAAGTASANSIAKIKRAVIEAQLAVHVTGNFMFLKHFVAQMPRGGRFVLFSSLTARVPGTGLAPYAAAKAALDQIVRIAALEFGPRGISVNAVAPGFSVTPMTNSFLTEDKMAPIYKREAALGALVTPDEVAAAVAWLAAPDCFMTGEIMHVSGGAQLGRLPRPDELAL